MRAIPATLLCLILAAACSRAEVESEPTPPDVEWQLIGGDHMPEEPVFQECPEEKPVLSDGLCWTEGLPSDVVDPNVEADAAEL
jgi:hypothetical protein